MSRIHEALKRAEEEKLAARATSTTPASAPLAETPVGNAVLSAPADAVVEVGLAPASAAPALSESMPAAPISQVSLKNFARKAWHPEKLMLFLNGTSQNGIGMEEFRTLRSRLYQLREGRKLKTILIASAAPAEGKTFVAGNLAQALARQHGRRTLLIDGDLRKPRLHECLGTDIAPGLSDYLRGAADELSIIQSSPIDELFFVPGGNAVANPAEVASSGRLQEFIAHMSTLFEWIIIDSPPVAVVSDAVLMASCCDGVLLVVEAGKTPGEMVQRAVQELHGAQMLGVVLNRAQPGYSSSSYYYKHYGYGKASREQSKQV